MARPSAYRVEHRRRREGKTDYRLRLRLLKSRKPRLVIRKFSKNITCQVVEYRENGDVTIASASASELKTLGWSGNTGNIPSAYLTGLACGIRAKNKISEAVPDLGMQPSTKFSRLYAALKGFIDAGVAADHSNEILPDDKRIKGEHIPAEKKPKNFDEIRDKIISGIR